jgi:hypothetical protein
LNKRSAIRWKIFANLTPLLCLFAPLPLQSQSGQEAIPTGTPFAVEIDRHCPMKVGIPIEARLLYSIYEDNRIAIPAGAQLRGRVVKLTADGSRRVHARLHGDFTPFHIPVVHFDELVLADGGVLPLSSGDATDGAPMLRLTAPAKTTRGGFVKQQMDQVKQMAKDQATVFTAPDKGDRALQFLYGQLPYHPERIEKGTLWTVELTQPLAVAKDIATVKSASPVKTQTAPETPTAQLKTRPTPDSATSTASANTVASAPAPISPAPRKVWHLNSYLRQAVSSAEAKQGDVVEAWVAEPVLNVDRSVAIPQGTLLLGTVTQSKPGRSFGRKGKLRFNFREMRLPEGPEQHIEGILAGADSAASADLEMDAEGGVKPKPRNRVIVPLVLALLANYALDDDASQAGSAAAGSNGLGLVGRVVGIAAGSRNLAAGIGFYGAALAFYDRWIAKGKDVVFAKNTRLEITASPSRESLLTSPPSK